MSDGIDPVERDPAALSSAEDFDEDRLQLDPLEEGMDPPEHWTQADRYGNTPFEQAHGEDLEHRLREEQPDLPADEAGDEEWEEQGDEPADVDVIVEPIPPDESPTPVENRPHAVRHGQSADEAGGSVADAIRTPHEEPNS